MSGTLQPLDQKFAIVDQAGRPTLDFIRWAQQRQIDIEGSITLADLQAYLDAHVIVAGTGIQFSPGPNGDLNSNPTIHADAQAILDEITATRGAVIYRGLLGWAALLPGTAGQVLSTNGAGADPSWVSAGGADYTKLATVTAVGTETQLDITVPTGHKDVIVAASLKSSALADFTIRLNGDTGTNYNTHRVFGGASASGSEVGNASAFGPSGTPIYGSSGIANDFYCGEFIFTDYLKTDRYKSMLGASSYPNGATVDSGWIIQSRGKWKQAVAINKISFITSAGTFSANSELVLYGRG